jgi:hypothetical protein
MIDSRTAVEYAEAYLERVAGSASALQLALWKEKSREAAAGWLFYWQTRQFLRTGDPSTRLIGGGPILVDREDASVHVLRPTRVDEQLEAYMKVRQSRLARDEKQGDAPLT